jgi:protein SCO1
MNAKLIGLLSAALLGMLLAACDRTAKTATGPAPATWVSYDTRGVVQHIEKDGRRVEIAHEAIPGYMAAMTMEFMAADEQELAGLQPADEVTFRLNVGEKESFIDAVRKTGKKGPVAQRSPESGSALAPGAELPDAELVDESGTRFRLSDLRGSALAITFIFTRCPLPDFCPRMNAHFGEVRKDLAAASPDGKWKLLSISIDPAYDTPDRLREYGGRFGLDRKGWSFATGDPATIRKLAASLGLSISGEAPSLNHNLRTVVINPEGRVARVFPGNEWLPAEVSAEMKRALGLAQ